MNLYIKPFRNSIILIHVGLLTTLLQFHTTQGQIKNYFDKKLCDVECGNRTHTLCESLPLPSCDKFKMINIFEVKTVANGKLLELLVNGHNGLRDRIAKKANIANMVKLTWDEDLAKMAIQHFKQCEPEVEDPCTLFVSDDVTDNDKLEYKPDDFENHRFVVQNRFQVKADFFPKNFIEAALRSWYREKGKIGRPIFTNPVMTEYFIGLITKESNFTHLAYPLVANFGCSIAQIDHYYELVCNYYPYYRTATRFMVFLSAEPTSNCPSLFPLKDESFINLCGNGEELAISFSLKIMPPVSCYMLLAIAEFVRILM